MTARVHPRVLLVEGKDETRILPYLLERVGVPWPADDPPAFLKDQDGVEKLLRSETLSAELKASGVAALGLLLDANGDPKARWERVRSLLQPLVASFPEHLPGGGLVHPSSPRIGVWIMPDNVTAGMLEDVLVLLRDGDSTLLTYSDQAVARAAELGAPFRPAHRTKAALHTWLAWQDPPGQQVHLALKTGQGLAPKRVRPLDDFVRWFCALYELPLPLTESS